MKSFKIIKNKGTIEKKSLSKIIDMIPNIKKHQIKNSQILTDGLIPVISQEKEIISGYYNNLEPIYASTESPIIVFGDHSCTLKLIDFNFILGGDGTKVFRAKNGLDTLFLYYCIKNIGLHTEGYKRHFSILKEKEIFDIPNKKNICNILNKQESIISNIEKLISKTEKMFEYFSENLLSGKILLDINDNIISSKEENIGCNILNGFTTEINKNFNIFKLSDIANTITGNTPPLNDESLWTDEDSGIKWISTPDLRFQKMGYISSHTRMLTNKGIKKARVCPKDTLLISCIATIGEVGLISEDSTFNQQINAILPNEIVNTKYLKYYFLHNKKNFIDYAPSSVVKIINKKLFNEFEIYLPPSRDWQDKIVNFLEKQEFLIENQKKLLEKEKQKFEWLSDKLLSGEYLVVEDE